MTPDRDDLLVMGNIVTGGRVIVDGAFAVCDGKITALLEPGAEHPAEKVLDYRGQYVLPGLVDTHVHSGSSSTEGITSTTAAAAAGGVTTIADMPFDDPFPIVDARRFMQKAEKVDREAVVDVILVGTMAKIDGVSELADMVAAGAAAFKFSTFETNATRFPRISEGDLLAAFEALAPIGIPIIIHAESQEIVDRLSALARAAGEVDVGVHARTRPPIAETVAICQVAELARWTRARLHVAHVAHPRGFEILDWYRAGGARVSGETCAHYLALGTEAVERHGALVKVNPPIRSDEVRDGLWEALEGGLIGSISSDHVVWPRAAKQRSMLDAAPGLPGLETLLALLATEAAQREFSFPKLVEWLSSKPADIFGLHGHKGRLEVGYDADFCVFDTRTPWTYDESIAHTNGKWNPLNGRTFIGKVAATYLRGHVLYQDGAILAPPGTGTWLRASYTHSTPLTG
jgi:allantoinase